MGKRARRSQPASSGPAPSKTIAARILDDAGVSYQLRAYALEDAEFSAEAVAELLGMPPEQVFKTLVAVGDRTGPLFALIPGGSQLDLKRLAAASGNRKVELAARARVHGLTGYRRGSVTVLGAKRRLPVFVDETAELHRQMGISGGAAGVQILLDPADLIAAVGAQVADIAR